MDEFGLKDRAGLSAASSALQILFALVCLAIGAYAGSLALQWVPFVGISSTPPGIAFAHRADGILPKGFVAVPDERM